MEEGEDRGRTGEASGTGEIRVSKVKLITIVDRLTLHHLLWPCSNRMFSFYSTLCLIDANLLTTMVCHVV